MRRTGAGDPDGGFRGHIAHVRCGELRRGRSVRKAGGSHPRRTRSGGPAERGHHRSCAGAAQCARHGRIRQQLPDHPAGRRIQGQPPAAARDQQSRQHLGVRPARRCSARQQLSGQRRRRRQRFFAPPRLHHRRDRLGFRLARYPGSGGRPFRARRAGCTQPRRVGDCRSQPRRVRRRSDWHFLHAVDLSGREPRYGGRFADRARAGVRPAGVYSAGPLALRRERFGDQSAAGRHGISCGHVLRTGLLGAQPEGCRHRLRGSPRFCRVPALRTGQ